MSFRKSFTPNRLVILLFGGLIISYFSHIFQSLLGLSRSEEVAAIILISTAILWISEALPLYITSLAVLFFQILWLLPVLQEVGIEATKEDFLIAFFGDPANQKTIAPKAKQEVQQAKNPSNSLDFSLI